MRKLDPDDSRAPYVQVAEAIRDAILAGEFKPGAAIPSRASLASHFGVAPMTVQGATKLLRDEGYVIGQQGRGLFVRTEPPRDLAAEIDELRERVEALERTVGAT